MNKNGVMFLVLGVVVGFVAGFMVANRLNRSEMDSLRGQSGQTLPQNSNSSTGDDENLSSEEIRSKIAEADKNPTNFAFQKNLGISLYRYGAMKQDAALIAESKRILDRAVSLDPKDFEVLVALGNADFDIGFFKKDLSSFDAARATYAKALALKPGDADVRTDMGISYFVQEPPDYDRAVSELQAVITANPKHDRAMQFLVQTYAKQGKIAEAERTLEKIVGINPTNPAIADLRKAISDAKGSAAK
jgi:tetratricopeptide (TPR) repeat protein